MRSAFLNRFKRKTCDCCITCQRLRRRQLGFEPLEDRRLLSVVGFETRPAADAAIDDLAAPPSALTDVGGNPGITNTAVDTGAYECRHLYVDDDAPDDPGPGDPTLSDPLENGTAAHPFDAIQEAIHATQHGDTVIVFDGTYTGSGNRDVDFCGKAITVRSQNGPENCIIDSQGTEQENHRGFYFHSGEDRTSVLSGFTITGGYISGGYVPSGWDCAMGGGIFCDDQSGPTIRNNKIIGNTALHGGGIFCNFNCSAAIVNNVIVQNTADRGGGIYVDEDAEVEITNNTIAGNRAGHLGGGIYNFKSNLEIINCILWDNGDELFNCAATYSCIQDGDEGTGNTSAYPYFVDADAGDYHLRSYSPCINAGDFSAVSPDALDIDGQYRILLGNVDMGADEATAVSPDVDTDLLPDDWENEHLGGISTGPDGDPDRDELPNLEEYRSGTDPQLDHRTVYVSIAHAGDPLADGTRAHPFSSVQRGIDVSTGRVLVAGGVYAERVHVDGKELSIEGGYGPDFGRRNPAEHATALDAQQSGRTVTYFGTPGGSLSGITITGGQAFCGGGIFCMESAPTITGNTITGNRADNQGGGIACDVDSPATIADNAITGNTSPLGGGVYTYRCAPAITGNRIAGNAATGDRGRGGGVFCGWGSSPLITGNRISENSAQQGGGIICYSISSPTVTGNIVTENTASTDGGGIGCFSSDAVINGNTITGNRAENGGGVYLLGEDYVVEMSGNLITGNTAVRGGGVAAYSRVTFTNNTVSGNVAELGGGIHCRDHGGVVMANCILYGNTASTGREIAVDSHWQDGSLTVGYSDVAGGQAAVYLEPGCTLNWGEGNIDQDPQFADAAGGNYRLRPGSPCIDAGDNLAVPSSVVTDLDGNPRFVDDPNTPDSGHGTPPIVDMGAYEYQGPPVVYVDADAEGANDGTNWADAFTDLQDALSLATAVPGVEEIRVAQGIYTPAGPGGSRAATFQLVSGVAVKGGYPGFGEPDPSTRDVDACQTILSGDLNGDDGPDFAGYDENSYHVVTGSATDTTAVLDGFTIVAGNADGPWDLGYAYGGAVYCDQGSPTIRDCTISANSASQEGGAMYNVQSSPTLIDCRLLNNQVLGAGGGIYSSGGGSLTLVDCDFRGNSGGWAGGAIAARRDIDVELANCSFFANEAHGQGAGIYSYQSRLTLADCCFVGNVSFADEGANGAAMYISDSVATITNCLFTGNSADVSIPVHGGGVGGAIYSNDSTLGLTQCTFSGNSAREGGGVRSDSQTTTRVNNCILWGNTDLGTDPEAAQVGGGTILVNYSCIQGWSGGLAGTGNIGDDPLLVDADGPDEIVGTEDDNLCLLPGSPCIDAGDNAAVPPSAAVDLDGNPRFTDDPDTIDTGCGTPPIVDMGAYEFQNPHILYVDADATRDNNGTSWADAFADLQDALRAAGTSPEISEIWVAQGTYTPAGANGDRAATFQLLSGVAIRGGYAGFGEANPNARDVGLYEAILSGDLNGDDEEMASPEDLLDAPTRAENSYHVVTGSDTDASAVLDGFTITAGNTKGAQASYNDDSGGGMYSYDGGSPTLIDCAFSENSANSGGAIHNGGEGEPTLNRCTFAGNFSRYGGGAIRNVSGPQLTASHCTFRDNVAGFGGAIEHTYSGSVALSHCSFIGNSSRASGGAVSSGAELVVTNCLFSGNSAGTWGGAIYCGISPMTVTQTTFSANSAIRGGGAYLYRASEAMVFSNCIFWDNRDVSVRGESAQIHAHRGTPVVNASCIQGLSGGTASLAAGGTDGSGNIGDDPLFVDADGTDNVAGTEDDNLRLLGSSPCLDAGDNAAVPPTLLADLDGNPRVENGTVDMGAYEGPHQGFILSKASISVPESGTALLAVSLAMDPLGSVAVSVTRQSGDSDITVADGGLLNFDSSNFQDPQLVTLAAAADDDWRNGVAMISVSAPGLNTAMVIASEADQDAPTVLYVDADAPGDDDGSSWEDAYRDLQPALLLAAHHGEVEEIRVAQGVYTPEGRSDTFQLVNGVAIKGGYAGFGQTDPDARDIRQYETMLSGDVDGNDAEVADPGDLLDDPTRAENCYRVVTGSGTDTSAILDGFVITGGNGEQCGGGGMYIGRGSPTVRDCVFRGNSAPYGGGGMAIEDASTPVLICCDFSENAGPWAGGGMWILEHSYPTLTHCTFAGNFGGGTYNDYGSSPTYTHCTFVGNVTDGYGGGIYGDCGNPRVQYCTFLGNSARYGGGGMYVEGRVTLDHCLFSGNTASEGGGLALHEGSATITNSTFSGNVATSLGGGMYDDEGPSTLTNCVFWGNRDADGMDESAQIDGRRSEIDYSCVQGWTGDLGGIGNIGADPLFVDADGPDDLVGTEDDNLRLLPGSSCIDAGDNSAVPPSVVTDLDGNPRFLDDPNTADTGHGTPPMVDMGAYEFQGPYVLYVDVDASGAGDGSSWADAYNDLQDALAGAVAGDEIWVAQGIYKPDLGGTQTRGDREATFRLISGMTIAGGFAGFDEPDPDARDVDLYETILSGDLGDDDGPQFTNREENSYHVVTAGGTDQTTVLDGFTITAGYADGSERGLNNGAGVYNIDGSLIISNCTIRDNSAITDGAGMHNIGGSPTLTNCTFSGNTAGLCGAGLANSGGSPTLTNCTFVGNTGRDYHDAFGGGMYEGQGGNATLMGCAFIGNSASLGGGMYNHDSDPTLINCVFSGNAVHEGGGGMRNLDGSPTLVNCTFSGNFTDWYGAAGIDNGASGSPVLTNCILWGNYDAAGRTEESDQIEGGTPVIDFSCLQGWTGDLGGTGNIGDDPLLVDADGPDDLVGTEDDNLRLLPGSSCIDAGDNAAVPPEVTSDLDGNPRIVNVTIDMGAYEFQGSHVIYVDADASGIGDGSSWANAYNDLQDALAVATGGEEIRVAEGVYAPAGPGGDRAATFRLLNGVVLKGGYAGFGESSPNARDVEAYLTLLSGDLNGDDGPNFTGKDENSYHVVTGCLTTTMDATTDVLDGFTITGGYANGSQADSYGGGMYGNSDATIIDCTLAGNFAERGGGMYCGPTWCCVSTPTLIDCTFHGNFAGSEGGGLWIGDSDVTLTGCRITENLSTHRGGGAMFGCDNFSTMVDCLIDGNTALEDGGGILANNDTNLEMTDCTLSNNCAGLSGGGIAGGAILTLADCRFLENSSLGNGGGVSCLDGGHGTLTRCSFVGNAAGIDGGGMHNMDGTPTLTECIFSGNSSGSGGGLFSSAETALALANCTFNENTAQLGGGIWGHSPMIIDCGFYGNSASAGGGMFNGNSSDSHLINCVFSGNAAAEGGGGMWAEDCDVTFTNCTFSGNSAVHYGGFYCDEGSTTATNCVFWGNSDSSGVGQSAQFATHDPPTVNYSCIEGWTGDLSGTGNIGDDPMFIDADGPDNVVGTEDDNLRLLPGSPCVDAGDNLAVPPSVLTDVDGNARFVDDQNTPDTGHGTPPIVDMGAYEYHGPCTFYVDDDAPHDPLPGDPTLSDPLENGSQAHPFDAIQEAIDAALDGDTVLVLAGTYTGEGNRDIGFFGKAITVRSDTGPDNCVIDCQQADRAFSFGGRETRASVLDGLTIRNGLAEGGGAIHCWDASSPTIANCSITGNRAFDTSMDGGGGILIEGSSPLIANCTISENSAPNGGAIAARRGSAPVITGCTITGNTAFHGGAWGGGIYCLSSDAVISHCTISENQGGNGGAVASYYDSETLITHCTISHNTAWTGGGIACYADNATIEHCTITDNLSTGYGGGIHTDELSPVKITGCLVTGNTAHRMGGGVYRGWFCETVITNCTITGNSASQGSGYYSVSDGTGSIANSILWGNEGDDVHEANPGQTTVVYSCVGGGWAGTGNIDADPLFVEPHAGDYRLLPGSSCIDAADNTAVPPSVVTDLDGNARFVDDPNTPDSGHGTPPIVDMGAYEFQVINVLYVDADAPGANNGRSWANAFTDLQDALSLAAVDPEIEEIRVAEGLYTPAETGGDRAATFLLINGVALRGGYAGFWELDPNARDVSTYETVLSGDLGRNDAAVADPRDLPTEPTRAENSYHVVVGSETGSTTILDGFTITGGNANNESGSSPDYQDCGGGMYNTHGSDVMVLNCTFRENSAISSGGGIHHSLGDPTLVNCTFIHNSAGGGGGMYILDSYEPGVTLVLCEFIGNYADGDGGGMTASDSRPTLTNCMFSGNRAGNSFGALASYDFGATLTNSTFSHNSAGNTGGGICGGGAITNCIFWGNSDRHGRDEWAQIYSGGAVEVNYSCIQGWTGLLGGTGNIGGDPLFTDADGADNLTGTADDDLRLLPQSSCLDAADNDAVPADTFDLDGDGNTAEPIPFDLDGNPRFADDPRTPDTGNPGTLGPPIVDMGAYEGAGQGFLLDTRSVIVPEGATASFTVALAEDPLATVVVTVAPASGDPDVTVTSGASLTFDPSNYGQPQPVTLTATEDLDNLNGTAVIWVSAPGFGTAVVRATEADNDAVISPILYVDADAPGINNGASWSEAYTELRDALAVAALYPGVVAEIRVAEGVYTPAEPCGSSAESFQLLSGLAIYGGYAGFSEPNADARDIEEYQTILSGDLRGDDVQVANPADLLNEPSRAENSFHVVTGSGTDATATLDGFTVADGSAAGLPPYVHDRGGGMYIDNGSPTVSRCTFRANTSGTGGSGICNLQSSPSLAHCTFIGNAISGYNSAGILSAMGSNPTLTDCSFVGNVGGGMANSGNSNSQLTRCLFQDNLGAFGGGMQNSGSNPTLTLCTFSGNRATYSGGGFENRSGDPTLVGCTFVGNSVGYDRWGGGGMGNFQGNPTLINCIFSGNSAYADGAGLYTWNDSPTLINCTFSGNSAGGTAGGIYHRPASHPSLSNCILWGNSDAGGTDQSAQISENPVAINYSCVQGWTGDLGGTGNIGEDPTFVDLDGADNIPGTVDDNLRLLPGSPCIDAGDNAAVPPEVLTDLDGNPRIVGAIVDMGAYEFQGPLPGEIRGSKFHDIDGDGVWDDGEPGLEGWTIYLDTDQDGQLDAGEPSTVTDAGGNYALRCLPPGTYTVAEVPQHGWRQTFPSYGDIERVNVAADGSQADDRSFHAAFSADGRFVAFRSGATNLVPDDTNGKEDLFLVDRQTGTIQCVSTAWDGSQANGDSDWPTISADGRFVAFESDATNLVPGGSSLANDVYVFDRQTNSIECASMGLGGAQGGGFWPALSANGRFVTFTSRAGNLVPGDTNGEPDVFVYDRQTGTTERVSLAFDGSQADRFSYHPEISAGGRFVTFYSGATNLVPDDTNGEDDVFVYDRQTHTVQRVSLASDGSQGDGDSFSPSISADGRYVAFLSRASNLVAEDGNGRFDIFLHDRQTATTRRVSVASDGSEANGDSHVGVVSGDGRYVAFYSYATNLVAGDTNGEADVFVYDCQTGATRRLSVAFDGSETNDFSHQPAISADGRYVAFQSHASNLVPDDTNGQLDVFVVSTRAACRPGSHVVSLESGQIVEDIDFGNRQLLGEIRGSKFHDLDGDGVWDEGEPGLEGWTIYLDTDQDGQLDTGEPSAVTDADGNYALTNLPLGTYTVAEVPQDRWEQTAPRMIQRVNVTSDGTQVDVRSLGGAALSADGRYVAFASGASNLVPGDNNDRWDVFVRDRLTGAVELVSLASDGSQGDSGSMKPSISADGRFVAFESQASNFVPGGVDDEENVFIYDRQTRTLQCASLSLSGIPANNARNPSISADGRYVTFTSVASDLVPNDTNGENDVFVFDRQTNTIQRVSVSWDGTQADSDSETPTISGDGRYVAFGSYASNLVPGDTNDGRDVFVYDRQTGTTQRVSVNPDGTQAGAGSAWPIISADGRYVAVCSSGLVPGDTNHWRDVFIYDRQAGTVQWATATPDGSSGNNNSYPGGLSADGRFLAFLSYASDLVPGDSGFTGDVFVYDQQTGITRRVGVAMDGTEGNGDSHDPVISADGRYVAFESDASNLVQADTNGERDVFFCANTLAGAATHRVVLDAGQVVADVDFGNRRQEGPLIVSTAIDENDGDYRPGDLSLREALVLAADLPGDDLIRFHAGLSGSTITLEAGLGQLLIDSNVEIRGLGADRLTVNADGNGRVFYVPAGVSATISGLTITGGRLVGDHGAGVYNDGTLTIADAVISGNQTDTDSRGGGIYNDHGTLTVVGTTIAGNHAGAGGGFKNFYGVATLTDVTISANTAREGGGVGNHYDATTTIINATISGNSPEGIRNYGDLTLRAVTISENSGGGILNEGPLSVADSTICNNTAVQGGGIRNYRHPATLLNTTISGNSSQQEGGGIYVNGGSMTLLNTTIADNRAGLNSVGINGGGIFRYHGHDAVVTLHNSIVAGNFGVDGTVDDVAGIFDAASSHNLIGAIDGSTNLDSGLGTLYGTAASPLNPRLGPLQDNGGPTLTHAVLAFGPAIDAGSNARAHDAGLTHDQRGFERFVDGDHDGEAVVDMGAYEAEKPLVGEIRGSKFNDLDGDGTWDDGEPGLEGWTVYVDVDQDGELDTGEPSSVTDAHGDYALTILPSGTYTVAEVLKDGWEQTFPTSIASGRLTFVEAILDGQTDGQGNPVDHLNGAFSVAVSPDGAHVYAATMYDGALLGFRRDPSTGELTLVQSITEAQAPLNQVETVAVSPDGKHVYIVEFGPPRLTAFSRDPATGMLTLVEVLEDGGTDGHANRIDGLRGATFVTLSPDGRHLYTTAAIDDALSVFNRDPFTGRLTFVQVIDGVYGARSATVSPDGRHVYAAATSHDALAVFERNPNTGRLTPVEVLVNGQPDGQGSTVDGLDWACSVAVSPDGSQVYAAGRDSHALAAFVRNQSTGRLTFVEALKDGQTDGSGNPIDGLNLAWSVTVSPHGNHVYVAAGGDDAVAVFRRNALTGQLSFVESLINGHTDDQNNTILGLNGAISVALSPEGRSVYVAASGGGVSSDSAVAVFRRDAEPWIQGTHRVTLEPGEIAEDVDFGNRQLFGPLDSFDFSTIGSPQHVERPFGVTIAARDAEGRAVTDFNGTVELSGWVRTGADAAIVISEVSASSPDTMEFTNVSDAAIDLTGWQVLVYDRHSGSWPLPAFTIPTGTVCPPGETFLVQQKGNAPGSYPHFYTGREISWQTSGPIGVLLTDAAGEVIDFMAAQDLDPAAITHPLTIVPEYWQGDQLPSLPSYSVSYQRVGDSDNDNAGDWVIETSSIGGVNPGLTVPFPGAVTAVAVAPTIAAFVDGVWTGEVAVLEEATEMYLRAEDDSGHFGYSNTFRVAPACHNRVVGRQVFYNNSAFYDPDLEVAAVAVAPGKEALLPGQTATFANYTSYSRGINGITVDIADAPVTPAAADFLFHVGNSDDPGSWAEAPNPASVTVHVGAGNDNSDRVLIVWDDYAIRNEWLQVTVRGEALGLASDEVFYFGNAVGESGNSDSDAEVNDTDVLLAGSNPHNFFNPATINCPYDYNRDARVDATDVLIAQSNQTTGATALKLIHPPALGGEVAGAEEALLPTPLRQDFSSPPTQPEASTPVPQIEKLSAYDAVFEQAVERESDGRETSLERLAWLYEFEEIVAKQRPSEKHGPAEEAVGELLATYLP